MEIKWFEENSQGELRTCSNLVLCIVCVNAYLIWEERSLILFFEVLENNGTQMSVEEGNTKACLVY